MVAGVREVQPGIAAVSGGTEGDRLLAAAGQLHARVINADGTIAGWQDKGQLDPSEESIYPAFGTERRVFTAGKSMRSPHPYLLLTPTGFFVSSAFALGQRATTFANRTNAPPSNSGGETCSFG